MTEKHDHDEKEKSHKSDPGEPQTAESDKPPVDPPEGPGGDDRG